LALHIYQIIEKKSVRTICGFFFIILLYYLAGGVNLLFAVSVILLEIIRKINKNNATSIWIWGVYIIISLVIPLILRRFIIIGPTLQSYFTEYYYQIRIVFPLPLILLWCLLPLFLLFFRFLPNISNPAKSMALAIALIFCLGLGEYYTLKSFVNFDEENEMAYDRLVRIENWDEIIAKSVKNKPNDKNSMVAVNLALAMKNELSEKMFTYNQNIDFLFIHYGKHGMVSHLASEIYYQLGFINYSKMYAMESNESSLDAKNSVRSFKRLAETALIEGQYKQAEKYLTILSKTLFYTDWAKDAITYLNNDKKIDSHPVWGKKRQIMPKTDYFLNKEHMDVVLFRSLIDNPQNQHVYEYLMGYYLLQKDFDSFLKYFQLMQTFKYSKVPLAFQEALVYIYTLLPKVPESLQSIPIDRQVSEGIRNYAIIYKQGNEAAKLMLKKDFGNTYWYYLHFTKLPSDSVQVEAPKHRE
jgi:hypothetical protein